MFGDSNVLICGKNQAQVLTKTIAVNSLPEKLEKLAKDIEINSETEIQMKNSIMYAHLFDARQEALVKKKHPVKLMWNFKRDLGITDQRKK